MKLGAVQTFPPSSRLAVLLSPSHVPWMSRGHLRPHWTFSLPLQTDFFSIVTCPVEWCHHPPTAQATAQVSFTSCHPHVQHELSGDTRQVKSPVVPNQVMLAEYRSEDVIEEMIE